MSEKKEEVLYREEYPRPIFTKKDWTPLHGVNLILLVICLGLIIWGEGDKRMLIWPFIFVCYLFISLTLQNMACSIIEVRSSSIYIYSWPFMRKIYETSFAKVAKCETETKNELKDRTVFSTKKNIMEGIQYWGCQGVRLTYENGDEVFIGSNKKEELLEAIEKAIEMNMDSVSSPE